jgi:hypothetical protein
MRLPGAPLKNRPWTGVILRLNHSINPGVGDNTSFQHDTSQTASNLAGILASGASMAVTRPGPR